jgi:hypothetical protein
MDVPEWLRQQRLSTVRAVTPSDTEDLPDGVCAGLDIGGGGDVKVTFQNGDVYTFVARPSGSFIPAAIARVWATGTSATNIGAAY